LSKNVRGKISEYISATNGGYCLCNLYSLSYFSFYCISIDNALVVVPGTPDGFKGWKRKYSSGYIAVSDKLYLWFRCDKNRAARRAQRVRREPMDPTVPPRPCVNGTMAGSANGEEQEESGAGETMEGEAISESMEE